MKSILAGVLASTIAATGTAWCQQAAVLAQPTLASPQAAPAGPDLTATMKALEEKLRSVGRLTWTTTQRVKGHPPVNFPESWEPMSIAADPKTCSLRVVYGNGTELANYAVYLEEISEVDVLTLEDYFNTSSPGIGTSIEPSLYTARVDSWRSPAFDFPFQTREAAEQFTALLRESVKQCSAVSVLPRAPATGSPSLTETISFIADKLSAQGVVSKSVELTINGSSVASGGDFNISKVSSPATCLIQLNGIGMGTGEVRLSLRRIGKIEVIKLKDFMSGRFAPFLKDGGRITSAPSTFVLEITASGGESKELYFSDETLANRVAKAINHAAELCGAGPDKEPF